MHQFFKYVSGILVGMCPVIVAFVLSYLLYIAHPSVLMIIVGIVTMVISLLIGYSMFKECSKVGILDFMTNLYATKDMDNLKQNEKNLENKN